MALENQKSSLTNELQNKIIEIKKHRVMIQKRLQLNKDNTRNNNLQDPVDSQHMSLQNKQKMEDTSSNNSTPRTYKSKNEMLQQMSVQIQDIDRRKRETESKLISVS